MRRMLLVIILSICLMGCSSQKENKVQEIKETKATKELVTVSGMNQLDLDVIEDNNIKPYEIIFPKIYGEFMMAPEGGINQAVDYATESSEWTTESGNKVMFFRRQVGYDQVWIAFADTKYVGQIYVNGFMEEEVKQLAEGISSCI